MTIQQLQYVLAAIEHGSFSAAAAALHLAQPSLSEQVRRLEAELGVTLFQRVGRGLVLTEAGRALRPHAEAALAAVDRARESVGAIRELRGGLASFGTFGTARTYLGADLVEDFRHSHPDVRVRLVGQNSSETADAVRDGELEAGLVVLPIDDRGLVLTEAGRALRPHAEAALAEVERARESVGAIRELRGGLATFGTFGTARTYLGADLVEDFRRSHPDVRVRLVGQNSSETVEAIRAGEIEAGLVVLPIDDRGLVVAPAMRDEVLFVSMEPERLRRPMTITRLAAVTLILSEASWGSQDPTRRQLSELAQREGVAIEPQIDVEDVEVALALAERGLGDTIMARGMLRQLAPSRAGWVPFAEPIYETFAFTWRRGAQLSPATREFVTFAERRLDALAEQLRTDPPRRRDPARRASD